jgi:hypothetical protein
MPNITIFRAKFSELAGIPQLSVTGDSDITRKWRDYVGFAYDTIGTWLL